MVEDLEADAFLIERVLKKDGYITHMLRVETEQEYCAALENETWDIVVSDYSLPEFGAPRALEVLNETKRDIPFIVVSGVVAEEEAVSTLRAGAEHFILKNDLTRLPVIVDRALAAATRRRANRQELQRHRDHLEELVGERTAALAAANENLKREFEARERTEEALRKNEARYRALVEGGMDGICILRDCEFTYVNYQFEELSGYTSQELFGTRFETHISEDYIEQAETVCACLAEGEGETQRFEAALIQKTGQTVDVEISAKPISYPGTQAVMLVVRDITSRRMAERMALQSEHSEALSVVAQGVAQSFANIMTVINSFAASIADSFLPHTRPYDAAKRILDATEHASDLTKRLYSVSRPKIQEDEHIEPVSLAKALKSARELVDSPLSSRNITIRVRRPGTLPLVMAEESELLDTLIHLLLNAVDAMPNGGTISIRTIERRISKPKSNPKSPGGVFVGICIQDSGEGMTKDQVDQAFEPFYTTKDKEDAFGLGLPAAQSMARSWGGWIDLRSRPGRGTRVRIFVPKATVSEADEVKSAGVGSRTVLLLDDNSGRRDMMRGVLERAGHTVLAFENGTEAIKAYHARADEISLSVIDWIMPAGDGEYVLQEILGHAPKANVVVVSGFSRDYARSQMRFGAWEFLQKPFSEEEFLGVVTKVLSRSIK